MWYTDFYFYVSNQTQVEDQTKPSNKYNYSLKYEICGIFHKPATGSNNY